ncbi:MAG: D-tyrosyl-tRNA(Tyr) deacylase [Clostridia bacterium]|nr:D-tyrosyl-tRNA(Tyr) deacylase [Clostridia bacterium]
MRLFYQRVSAASVTVDGAVVGRIGAGAVLLLGIGAEDTEAEVARLAKKTAELRVFSDEDGKFRYSLLDVGGEALVISNFTLYGNCRHGRRPEFLGAARPETAIPLYEAFLRALRALGVSRVEAGVFGADMKVDIHADGPVSLWLDTDLLVK